MLNHEPDGVTVVGPDFETLTIRLTEWGELFIDLMQPGDHAWVTLDVDESNEVVDYLIKMREELKNASPNVHDGL